MADEEQTEEKKATVGELVAAQVRAKRHHGDRVTHYRIGWMTGAQGTPAGAEAPVGAPVPEHARNAYMLGRAHGWQMYSEIMLRFESLTPGQIEIDFDALPDELKGSL